MTVKYIIQSQLLYGNIRKELSKIKHFIKTQKTPFVVDLSDVNQIDTVGIAFLVELKNISSRLKSSISYIGITSNISNLLDLYDINI